MEQLLGKMLGNTYRMEQLLGKGGMGAVYRARDVALNRDVAIKVMHPNFAGDEGFRARFLQEARAIAALNHPGIVQVYAFGQDAGLLYIVMDLVLGQTLQSWFRQLAAEHKMIALEESLAIVQRTATALHYAHEKGVLHRDVKPSNILLKPVDPALLEPGDLPVLPVLTDFGLAKLAEGGVHTLSGTAMGTPAYMSPEQCSGVNLDRRTDVYSLGVVLFELVTGQVPFEAKSLTEAIRQHTQEPPPPPRAINALLPIEVENVILRALAKSPQDRFASAREMAEALKTVITSIATGQTVAPTAVQGSGPYASLVTRLSQEAAAYPHTLAGAPAGPSNQIDVRVAAPQLTVAPGGSTLVPVIVSNHGAAVERLWVAVEGIPLNWLPTLPPALQLLPGAQQEFTLSIQPPVSAETRAGRYNLTIQVASQDDPVRSVKARTTLTVAPYVRFHSTLKPQSAQAGANAQVLVENQGNTPSAFAVTWQDEAGELLFEPAQAQLTVPPGQTAAADFRAAPRQNRWLGGAQTHPFSAMVRASFGNVQTLNGEIISKGLVPLWLPLVVLFLCILGAGAAGLILGPEVLAGLKPTRTSTPSLVPAVFTPTPTMTLVLTFTPVPVATPTQTPVPTDTPQVPTFTPVPDHVGLVQVPGGELVQGSTEAQIQEAADVCAAGDTLCSLRGLEDELPQRTVHVDAFSIDQHEVTNAEYAACVQAGACQPPTPATSNTRSTYFNDPTYANYPVVYVTWQDADTYCRWAGKRLPTEAEWEKAARGPDGLQWPWGNTFSPDKTNFRRPGVAADTGDTRPVGSYPEGASPYGAVDMVGNVWEWVADWYAPSYAGLGTGPNPQGPSAGDKRVIRGGSWNSNIAGARAASRAGSLPEGRFFDIGFRCAK